MLPEKPVWFITGCSTGIGAAFAAQAHQLNHPVVATARNPSTLSYLPDNNPSVLKLQLDVTSDTSINAALQSAVAHFKRIDILVNNAGYNRLGVTEAVPESEVRDIMETVFWGAARLTTRILPIMRETNAQQGSIGGTIIQITSMGGRVVFPGNAGYHAAKHALEAFTETISLEVQPEWNIKFLIVEPGGTKTQFGAGLGQVTGHPAYNDEKSFMSQLFQFTASKGFDDGFAKAEDVVRTVWGVVKGGTMPLRLPTGGDAWSSIKGYESKKMEELEEWKEVSEGVGGIVWA
ncbi:hypothetical protein LTS08_005243 [Lithohypha guttulata]|nr:hypothetical protein LTS08_005243 [Lithohypha guttulata]